MPRGDWRSPRGCDEKNGFNGAAGRGSLHGQVIGDRCAGCTARVRSSRDQHEVCEQQNGDDAGWLGHVAATGLVTGGRRGRMIAAGLG